MEQASGANEPMDLAVLGPASRMLQQALGGVPALLGAPVRGGKIRFWGDPGPGRRPAAFPASDAPSFARAWETGGAVALTRAEAERFGAEEATAVPFEAGDAAGLCVIIGSGPERLGTMLDHVGASASMLVRMLGEREERRRRIGELEGSLTAFRALMEATSDAVKIVDLDGRIRAWNRGCERLYGYTAREVIGQVMPHVPPAGRTRAIADFRRIATLSTIEERQLVAVRKDGSLVSTTATAIPLHDAEGLQTGIMTIVRSIEADSRLERMQGEFLSLVSQELRNPLTALMGFAQLLGRPEIADDPRKRARTVRALESRAQRMATAVDDLLLASRVERGELLLKREPVELATLVPEVVGRFEQFESRHRLVIDVDTRIGPVSADARRLGQAVTNLLSNAVKYSPSGREVRVRVVRDGGDAVIDVRDHGVGIAAAEIERVFDRFYKTDADRAEPGAGLGLYLVKAIVEGHGGTVSVTSKQGQGSTFTIRLPLSD